MDKSEMHHFGDRAPKQGVHIKPNLGTETLLEHGKVEGAPETGHDLSCYWRELELK